MSETNKPKSFIDSMFDAAEGIVEKLEESKELSEGTSHGEDGEDEDNDAILSSPPPVFKRRDKNQIIFGAIGETYHIFDGVHTRAGLCGRAFEYSQFKHRRTEMDLEACLICGSCLRILVSRYMEI